MRLHRLLSWLAALAAFLWLAGCATPARHPALARAEAAGTLPPLVPMRRFVANVDFERGFLVSPDGEQLVWSRTVGTDAGLAVRAVAGGPMRTFATGYLPRPVGPAYTWLPDSRHVAYLKDLRGDENTQLHVLDSTGERADWHVTPWPGVRSFYVAPGERGSPRFFFASNRRDRSTMDLYEADAASRTVREVARSDGHVLYWIVGEDQRLAGRVRQLAPADGSDAALEVLQPDDRWRPLRTIGGWDFMSVQRIDPGRRKAWALSNLGRDKTALIEIDTDSGAERVLASHPLVDLSVAYFTRFAAGPVASLAEPGHPAIEYLDAALGSEVARAAQRAVAQGALAEAPRALVPQSSSEDGRRWVLRARGDHDDAELLLDRTNGAVTRLDPPQPQARVLLSAEEPFSFQASDGRTLHGYVIRPRGVDGPAPMVVMIHGGPWARDRWSPALFSSEQMLANRGYAVLSVNYRGSAGYGREYMMAARHEYFGRLQQDIAEAADWAVAEGIADPRAMAVAGASFGGYSVLTQLIQQRHDWRCGIDWVGVANWTRIFANWPPYWRNRHMFEHFLGDPGKPEERARILQQSPVTHLDKIKAPLLVIHGANDVRVLRQDSDDVVEGLRKLGRPVEYLSFDDEGHAVRRWRNRLEMWRRVEDTLAACLGGRSAGWDLYQLMPR